MITGPALSQLSEHDLIAQTKKGDRQAFGELVLRHRGGAIQVVYRITGNAQIAEELVQEAFVRAWVKIHRFRPDSSFRNWLYRIATNATLDMLRREKETVNIDTLPLPTPQAGPETALERSERGEQVRQAVLALPTAARAVLVLREYEGLSYREIAEALEIPLGTVMSRLNYARTRLRELLTPHLETL